jgi:RNase P subunit RPR2
MNILEMFKEYQLSPVLKEKLTNLEKENIEMKKENNEIKRALKELSEKFKEIFCHHCGSINLTIKGKKKSNTPFGHLGVQDTIYLCNDCNSKSYIMDKS